jgi:ornithine carbamoyltransferase
MWDRRHFMSIYDLDSRDVKDLLDYAIETKEKAKAGGLPELLKGRSMAMIFRKPSLRTRMSFEMAMVGAGGHAFYVSDEEIKMGRREAVSDASRVVSRFVDIIMIRTFDQAEAEDMARFASVPVINGLTDLYHPCQVMGDIMTVVEHKGNIEGLKVAFLGDGNNVANSWINAAARLDFEFVLGTVEGYEPDEKTLSRARNDGAKVKIVYDPVEAVKDAAVVYTDVWTSMGQEDEAAERKEKMCGLQVNTELLGAAAPDAIVLHCLPAHRGEEITDEVMDGPQSVVFDEAENRMHIQRAIILKLLLK